MHDIWKEFKKIKPTIQLYRKNNFIQRDGIYDEFIENDFILHEYGFEATL